MIFRKALDADLPHIIALLADDVLGQMREVVSNPPDAAYTSAFEAISQDPNQFLAVLTEADGRILGTLQLTFLQHLTHHGAKRAQVEAVRVARSARGRGIGKIMLQHAIAEAKARNCGMIQLTTDKERQAAHAFYEGFGFVPSHTGFKLKLGAP